MGTAYCRPKPVHKITKADSGSHKDQDHSIKSKARSTGTQPWHCPSCGRRENRGAKCENCLGRVRVPASPREDDEIGNLTPSHPIREIDEYTEPQALHPLGEVQVGVPQVTKKIINLPPDLLELDMELDREEREAEEAEEEECRRKEEERMRQFQAKQQFNRKPQQQSKAHIMQTRTGPPLNGLRRNMHNEESVTRSGPPITGPRRNIHQEESAPNTVSNCFKYSSEGSRNAQAKPRTRPLREAGIARSSGPRPPGDIHGMSYGTNARNLQKVYNVGRDPSRCNVDPVPPPALTPTSPNDAPQLLRLTSTAAPLQRYSWRSGV